MIMPIIPFSFNTVDYNLDVPARLRRVGSIGWGLTMRGGIYWPELSMDCVCQSYLLLF